VEPKEKDPSRVRNWFVVEVGRRQVLPFLALVDPDSECEVRLYVDSVFSVLPGYDSVCQHDDSVFAALDILDGQTITTAAVTSAGLEVDFGAVNLRVDGRANELTSREPGWFGRCAY
jgi:hypothetical protein